VGRVGNRRENSSHGIRAVSVCVAWLDRPGDRGRLLDAAAAFDAAGCRYQWARTLRLAGGTEATTGAATLAALGLAPMGAGIGG
jgi:hypothetical protein